MSGSVPATAGPERSSKAERKCRIQTYCVFSSVSPLVLTERGGRLQLRNSCNRQSRHPRTTDVRRTAQIQRRWTQSSPLPTTRKEMNRLQLKVRNPTSGQHSSPIAEPCQWLFIPSEFPSGAHPGDNK